MATVKVTSEIAIRLAGTNQLGNTEYYTIKLPDYRENTDAIRKENIATLLEPYLKAKFIAGDASTDTVEFATLFWDGMTLPTQTIYFTTVDQVTTTNKTVVTDKG